MARDLVPFPLETLQWFLERGYTPTSIETELGWWFGTLERYLSGERQLIEAHRAEALKSVDPEDLAFQPAWRAARRLKSLNAAGHSYQELAEKCQISKTYVATITSDRRKWVSKEVFQRVDLVWEELSMLPVKPPPARVAKKRWAVPWEWDDIDDFDNDLHYDAMISSDSMVKAVRSYIDKYGEDRVAHLVGNKKTELRRLLEAKTVRVSTRDRVVGALYRKYQRDLHRRARESLRV